ncbi:MAG: hypothetical protein AAF558_06630 [Verrucomicrobiota bacterium]
MTNWGARKEKLGFSLTEIVIALGVVSFGLVSLLGLFSTGLKTNKESMEDVQAANLVSLVLSERRAAPLASSGYAANFAIPPLDNPTMSATNPTQPELQTAYLTKEGVVSGSLSDRYYRMSYWIQPAEQQVVPVYIALSHPWQTTSYTEATTLYEVLTHINLDQ